MIKTCLRYPGGKAKVAHIIAAKFPSDCETYVEPMVGGGSIFLAARQTFLFQRHYINDLYHPVYSFWKACSITMARNTVVQTLLTILESGIEPRVWYNVFKDRGPVAFTLTDLEYEAVRFFIINRCSFSGTSESGGFSLSASKDRFTLSSVKRIAALGPLVEGVGVLNNDAIWEASMYANMKHVFQFLDPPYFTAENLYGENGSMHQFDHAGLAKVLKDAKCKFLMTYDDCPEIRELYSWAKVEPWSLAYSMSKKKIGNELFISNY